MAPLRKISLVYTFALLAAICTTFVTPVEANNIGHHARMIKKRAAETTPTIPIIGVGADPSNPTDPGTPTQTNDPAGGGASGTASPTGVGAGAGGASKSANPSATPTNPGLGLSLTLPGLGSTAPATPSASNSVNSTLSNTSTSSSTTTSSSSSLPPTSSSSSGEVVIATVTSSPPTANQAAASTSGSSDTSGAASGGGGHLTRNTIIAIVVVAACVGGAVIIWTVIRKWKFAPSDEFGDRLNPIDWRPTNLNGEKEEKNYADIDGTGVGHRRRGSGGSNRSFVSADAHSNPAASIHGNGNIPDLPPHDFTAPAGHGGGLAPVGAYADLRRGASPTPSMGDQYHRGYGATQQYGGHNGY